MDPILATHNSQIQSILEIIGTNPLKLDVGKDNDGDPIIEGASADII